MALEWFNGDKDAEALHQMLSFVSHVWDDLIDKDKVRSDADVNKAFLYSLVFIPMNIYYVRYREALAPLIHMGIVGFQTANLMEKSGDAHQIEVSHGLRYSIAQVTVFLISVCNSPERALEILPTAWKTMMPERWGDYSKEHGYAV